jgi:hypothetical protein
LQQNRYEEYVMKPRLALITMFISAFLVLGFAVGCERTRSDAQVGTDVQNKINSDPAVQSRQYSVTANNGVVTLSGYVGSDAERAAAASDAAQVAGVKTVVNDLKVVIPTMAQAEAQPPEQAASAPPEPLQRPREPRREVHSKPSGLTPGVRRSGSSGMSSPTEPSPVVASNTAPVVPPPPSKPVELTVPEGTTLSVRLIDPIDSEKNQPGDSFRATLDSPIAVGDAVAIPAGADIYGRVTNAKSAAHFAGRSELALEVTRISVNGKSYELHTDQYSRQGAARGKNTATKVGAGAALGAIIGGIAGGGKGAAIGAGVGAGAGGATQAITHGQQIRLTSEQVLAFHLESPITITPSQRLDRNQGRQRMDNSQ